MLEFVVAQTVFLATDSEVVALFLIERVDCFSLVYLWYRE